MTQSIDTEGRQRAIPAPQALPEAPALDRPVQDHLGAQLRAMYEDLLQEPVPGHILMLLARLERQDRERDNGC